MTIVVYRDGIIAADMASFCGPLRISTAPKISRNAQGDLFGACSNESWEVKHFIETMAAARDPLTDMLAPETFFRDGKGHGFMARPNGEIYVFNGGRGYLIEDRYMAIGAGCEAAFGALDANADAILAVRIAIARVNDCDYPVMAMDHEGLMWRIEHSTAPLVQQPQSEPPRERYKVTERYV